MNDLASTLRWWETATLAATATAAVLTAVSTVFGFVSYYRKKHPHNTLLVRLDRRVAFERTFQVIGLFASVVALGGAICAIKYTAVNRIAQHESDAENLRLRQQLKTAADQSAAALQTASADAQELDATRTELSRTTNELTNTYRQLADTKERLQRVESQQQWRTLTPQLRRKMTAILSKYKGNGIAMNPEGGDNEVQEFTNELDSVFKDSGWQTVWAGVLSVRSGPLLEGLSLQMSFEIEQHKDIERALIDAVKIADPDAKVDYASGEDQPQKHVIHLQIGRKRRVQRPQ